VEHNLELMKITLNIPESVQSKAFDFSLYVASKMYEDGLLSAGQASEMAGVSKRTFIELIGKYGVSVFSSSVDDLLSDISNA
jgi:predicted HTH domain antitoxin